MASSFVHNPKTLDVLSALDPFSFESQVYRVVFEGRDPTIGSLAGGRWAPPDEFETLYTSVDADCAIAEVLFHLERQPLFPATPVELHTLEVHTTRTIDITSDNTWEALELDSETLTALNCEHCQHIGHAAQFLGFDAIQVRSARHPSNNLVVFVGHVTEPILSKTHVVIDWSEYR